MAGTVDAYIQSHQTERSIIGSAKTGMGNMHEGKKVKVDFDVFKELGKGQAVVIDKGRKIQDIIQIWDAKGPQYMSELANVMSPNGISRASEMPTLDVLNAKISEPVGILKTSLCQETPQHFAKRRTQNAPEQKYFKHFQKSFEPKGRDQKSKRGSQKDHTTYGI